MSTDKLVLTLGRDAAATARSMAGEMGVTVPELVRRSLSLMQLWQSLPERQELVIRHDDGLLERVKFMWAL